MSYSRIRADGANINSMVSDVVSNVQVTSVFNYLLFAFFRVLVGNQDQEDKEDRRYYDTLIHLFLKSVCQSYADGVRL